MIRVNWSSAALAQALHALITAIEQSNTNTPDALTKQNAIRASLDAAIQEMLLTDAVTLDNNLCVTFTPSEFRHIALPIISTESAEQL